MFYIDQDSCTACDACIEACPCDAVIIVDGKHTIDPDLCVECGACYDACEWGSVFEANPADMVIPKKDL